MKELATIESFMSTFKPDLNRYVEKDIWGKVNYIRRTLTKELIERFFQDESPYSLSFFLKSTWHNYVGLDIDDHVDGGWDGSSPTCVLRGKYNDVITEIGEYPDLVFKSPRGIHVFYFLSKCLPNKVIEDVLKDRFRIKGLSVEILPTEKHSLAIPRPKDYLDSSLRPAGFPGYRNIALHNPVTILGKACLPDSISQSHNSGRADMRVNMGSESTAREQLEAIEAKYLPLRNGETNEAYKPLVGGYYARGLSQEQAVIRFKELVAKSPGYSGILLNGIETRVASSYRNLNGMMGTAEMGNMGNLYGEPKIKKAIEHIFDLEKNNAQDRVRMKEPHRDFLLQLISWIRFCARCHLDKERSAYWDYKYPKSSEWYSEAGYFPLPHSLLRKWNKHYDRHLRLLKVHGIIKESPYGYSTTQKRCKYYRITVDIQPD
jgi:hypothetical protein